MQSVKGSCKYLVPGTFGGGGPKRRGNNHQGSLQVQILVKFAPHIKNPLLDEKMTEPSRLLDCFSIQTVHFLTGCKRDGLCITTQVLNFLPSQANVRTKQGFSVSVPLKYHHRCLKCQFWIDLGPSRNKAFHFQGFHKNKCPLSLLYILYPPTSPTLATFYWEFTKQLSVLTGCNSNSNW